MQDVDYPIGLVAYGQVEVQNLKVGKIEHFSDKPIVVVAEKAKAQAQTQDKDKKPGERRATPPPKEDRRRRRGDEKKGP